jgi:hypothetical protein
VDIAECEEQDEGQRSNRAQAGARRNSSGSLASFLPVVIADDEAGVRLLDGSRAAGSGVAEAWRNQVFDRAAACGKACG